MLLFRISLIIYLFSLLFIDRMRNATFDSSPGRSGSSDIKQVKLTRARKAARWDAADERSHCTDQVPPKSEKSNQSTMYVQCTKLYHLHQ